VTNHRLIQAIQGKAVDRTPVWLMRQAGRYLPEYRKIRSSVKDFLTLCKTPELASIVTLQPVTRYPLDAAIIFSDILTIPDAYGLGLSFIEGEGPRFLNPIRSEAALQKLPQIDPEETLGFVMETIRLAAKELRGKIPIIGFAGSPWTIATYMVEGESPRHFSIIKRMMYQSPHLLHALLSHLSETIIAYLFAQIKAGAEVIMLFDTWGGVLSHPDFLQFSLNYMKNILQSLAEKQGDKAVPIILFTKNGGPYLSDILNSGADCVGLDWTTNLQVARKLSQGKVALQGNLDPATLYAPKEEIVKAVGTVLEQYGNGSGHVFNLGHGMHPDIDPDQVNILLEALNTLSPEYHSERSDRL